MKLSANLDRRNVPAGQPAERHLRLQLEAPDRISPTRRMPLNLALVTALLLVGLTAHSLGVLAAGADYLADAAAIGTDLRRSPAGHCRAANSVKYRLLKAFSLEGFDPPMRLLSCPRAFNSGARLRLRL